MGHAAVDEKNIAELCIDAEKCIGCGLCTKVCPNDLLLKNEKNQICHREITQFGWSGCWRCQHCMAVCPVGAISVLGKKPEEAPALADVNASAQTVEALVSGRRSHRRYLKKNVEKEVIERILKVLQNAPNGGNKCQVEYTLIDDVEQMDRLRQIVTERMEALARKGIYANGFDEASYRDLKRVQRSVRPDMVFCGVPHLLIPHAPVGSGCWQQDTDIACGYFELLCNAHGLGTVMMSYCVDVLNLMPDIRAMLEIPKNHYYSIAVGFGYPEIRYARGTDKAEQLKLHIPHFPADERRDGEDAARY